MITDEITGDGLSPRCMRCMVDKYLDACPANVPRTIAYLTDNCGEVVFDKLLIAQILRINPGVRVTAIVRGV